MARQSESGKIARCDHRMNLHLTVFCGSPKRAIDPNRYIVLRRDYRTDDGMDLICRFPEHVGVAHETVLLALLHIAEKRGHADAIKTDDLKDVDGIALTSDIWRVETTAYEILSTIGRHPDAKEYDRLERQLVDLSQVHLTVRRGDTMGASTIMGFGWNRDQEGRIQVRLCWRLALILAGSTSTRKFALVDLVERDQLSDVGKTLHRWLSAHCWPGQARRYEIDTLGRKAWRDETTVPSSQRRRRVEVRSALKEIGCLADWRVTVEDGVVRVERE